MPINDYFGWVHGKAAPTTGVVIGGSAATYSEDEIDIGGDGGSNLLQIANPNLGATGNMGLHFVVMSTAVTLTSINVWIQHKAATGANTSGGTYLVGRYFALADLVAGSHFFIPMPPTCLEFIGVRVDVAGTPAAFYSNMYFGPNTDGAK